MQQEPTVPTRTRPRAYHPSTKSNWSVGDIARITINGEEQDVVFSNKVKDERGRYLVMANSQTGKEIFAADGETELPLPPFTPSALLENGSRDLVRSALTRVHPYWDLPNLTLEDMARPELAGYFDQFRNLPNEDDDPSTLEKLGFKPPAFYIRKHEQDRAAAAMANGSRPNDAAAGIHPSSESISPGPALVPSPTTNSIRDSILPNHPVSDKGAEIEPDSGERGGTDAARAGEPRKVQDPTAEVDEARNIGSGREREVNEEEEVENVLASNGKSNIYRLAPSPARGRLRVAIFSRKYCTEARISKEREGEKQESDRQWKPEGKRGGKHNARQTQEQERPARPKKNECSTS